MSVQPFYDADTEGLVYHVVPTYQTESVSEIVTETESAVSTTTIESGDVSEYFVTHHGRLQPASENVFRWLPLDNTRRDILRHVVEKYLFGNNYIGPVGEILGSDPGPSRQHQVLEIGTRGGSWAQEMATEFPHVHFTSVDVAPLVPHVPRPNLSFEVYDISQGLMAEDSSQDIVFINGGREMVMNYQALLLEAHRILRPGGLIHIREYGPGLWDSRDSSKPARETNPKGCEAFDLVLAAVARMGADPDVCAKIPQWLSSDSDLWKGFKHPRGFEKIYPTMKLIPPHPHDDYPCSSNIDPRMVPLIRHYNLACVRDGVGLLCDSGLTMEDAELLIEAMAEEYKYPEKCPLLKWHTVYATKRSSDI